MFRVSSLQAIKFHYFDSGLNRNWCAVCRAFEGQRPTRTRYLLYLTWHSQHPSRHCCQQSWHWQRKRSLGPFRNLNDKSCRDFTRKDLQHMVFCSFWQKQQNSLRQRTDNFYIHRFNILGSHKQHINPKEWELVRDSIMQFCLWM